MIHLPYLSNGCACQYPIVKTREFRTIANELADGSEVKLGGEAGERVTWELEYRGLTGAERQRLEEFFSDREGALTTFPFLDPTDNLVAFSEDFTDGAWMKGPGLVLTDGGPGPLAGSLGTRISNSAPTPQRLEQVLRAPGDGTYCFSLYARGPGAATLSLRRNGAEVSRTFEIEGEWRRISLTADPETEGEQVTAGVAVEAGAAIEVCGAQVECQAGESDYKRTRSKTGVYPHARFAQDEFVSSADGADQYSVTLRVTARR
jgi:hypothetical protein